MKLTDNEIDEYIQFIQNTRQVYEEVKWLIEHHVDDEGLENIKGVVTQISQ